MSENLTTLSDDRKQLIILFPNGMKSTMRSERPEGFTEADVERARTWRLKSKMLPGQRNRARRFTIAGQRIYTHIGTGPPTWWLPKMEISKTRLMLGWLRVMVAVARDRNDDG